MNRPLHDVYTAADIAQVAGVPEAQVQGLIARGEIRSISAFLPADVPLDPALDRFVPQMEAVRVVRALRAGRTVGPPDRIGRLLPSSDRDRPATVPFLVSTSIHGVAAAAVLIIASLGFARADAPTEVLPKAEPVRMVFLMQPGPGGGGGGGGLKMPTPPPKAERKGERRLPSPLPARRLEPPMRPPVRPPPPPPPLDVKTLPPVMAPVVTSPADTRDREGVLEKVPEPPKESQGPGTGRGVGSGQGTGVGEGSGPGIGEGEGGGTGGGPYRPGSGVDPPRLLKEVRADYTDDARRANITGEVLLEIVVRRDGGVGDVRVLRGLNAGLNARAIDAVRQWRFAPARLKGTPVDVVVEVSVEFKLR
jgi:periplasmic protein TonB